MARNAKQHQFDLFRQSLAEAGLQTASDLSLICPLCWKETSYDDLSEEHIVPGKVGGRQTTLTCRRCNNDDGRDLDAHLVQYQRIVDAFHGYGTLKTTLHVSGRDMVANLKWGEGYKDFRVVGKATNPAHSDAVQAQFADGNVSNVRFTVHFDYAKNNFQTAILRAAYLVLFDRLGYQYVRHKIVQTIRRRIANRSLQLPRVASLVIEARNFVPPYEEQHYIVPGNVNGVAFLFVLIRVRRRTTSYFGAYLPAPCDRSGEFFDLMEQAAEEHNGETLTIPGAAVFS